MIILSFIVIVLIALFVFFTQGRGKLVISVISIYATGEPCSLNDLINLLVDYLSCSPLALISLDINQF